MEGIRIKKYKDDIDSVKNIIAKYSDIEQVAILHELIDDTPYKTKNYMKYIHDEYYIKHNKSDIIEKSKKYYQLDLEDNEVSNGIIGLIKDRYSIRDYKNIPIKFKEFSQILHYSMGLKCIGRGAYDQREFPFKYCNSQGGLNHLDLYLIVNNVEGVEQGLYYYDFIKDRIYQVDKGNMRSLIGEVNFQNEFSTYSSFLAIIVTDLSRVVPKYYKRAYRMAHVDAGILAGYLQLVAENNNVNSCVIAGYLEHKLEDILNLSENDYPVLTMSFGYRGGLV